MDLRKARVLITGSDGFIGKNLVLRLSEFDELQTFCFKKQDSLADLNDYIKKCNFVIHLAGSNRSEDANDFKKNNIEFTKMLLEILSTEIQTNKRIIPLIFTSSTQIDNDSNYGKSKLEAESVIRKFSKELKNPVKIYRLPGVFGKWCKPNYNSVVATFCSNIVNNLKIDIHDADKELLLVYIDDVIDSFIKSIVEFGSDNIDGIVNPQYKITIKQLANILQLFFEKRKNIEIEEVGSGLKRALYSTLISYLPTEDFSYPLKSNNDDRGNFVEMIKTKNSGQFSFFTAHPGITRGGHYHHTKTEKFLVIKGEARFSFRHMLSGATSELKTSGSVPEVVDTIPGWAHDITNIGDEDLVVMLWANETFDKDKPDTISFEVKNEKN